MKLMRYTRNIITGLAWLSWSLLTDRHRDVGEAMNDAIRNGR